MGGRREKAEGHKRLTGEQSATGHRRPPPLSLMDGRPRARRVPLHREMRALTEPASSSTVAPRSRRQRHGRKRLEKHGQGCAAGSAAVSMGRADTVMNR